MTHEPNARHVVLALAGEPGNSSTARRKVTQNDIRHFSVVTLASLSEALHDALAIFQLAILAHLPLAIQPRDGKAKADDSAQHHLDKTVRRIR